MLRRIVLPSLAALALVLSACSGGVGNTSDTDAAVACASDEDCPLTYLCKQALCVPRDPSTGCGALGCPEHQLCDTDDRCKRSGEKSCSSDAECGEFTCVDGRCIQSCVAPSECEAGLTCNNGIGGCVECTFDTDCGDPARTVCNPDVGVCVECNTVGQCGGGRFCDLAEGSATRYTCLEGCLDGNDCDPGTRCERTGTEPGRCVECTPDTQGADCLDAALPLCHPDLRRCVECVDDSACGAGHCTADGVCVECLEDGHCPMGRVCEANACVDGCRADDKCPPAAEPAKVRCKLGAGTVGACVDCLTTDDCELGFKCSDSACVEGCDTSAHCPPEAPSCDLIDRRCVECTRDTDCPNQVLRCDTAAKLCVCAASAEVCNASDECGTRSYDTNACEGALDCASEVKCTDGTWRPLPDARCASWCQMENDPSNCASGQICRYTRSIEGSQKLRCTDARACP